MNEEQAVRRGLGKWSRPGVPHRGWECVETYDNNEDDLADGLTFECDMCEAQLIRYVHVMRHPDHPEELHCGCVCAGHMEQDYKRARRREDDLKNRAARRRRFPDLKGWRTSKKGNPYIVRDGWRLIVHPSGPGYKVRAVQVDAYGRLASEGVEPVEVPGSRTYADVHRAKLGAFDALEYVKGKYG